jgi:hypothetical protein
MQFYKLCNPTDEHYQYPWKVGPHPYATLSYVPPSDPPRGSKDWDEHVDYPGIELCVYMPCLTTLDNTRLDPNFFSLSHKILDKLLDDNWGCVDLKNTNMFSKKVYRRPTLLESENEAKNEVLKIQSTIQEVLNNRSPRLKKRDAAIAKAHFNHGDIFPVVK